MTSDALLVINFLFSSIWQFFTSWYIPGTNVTPASFFFFLLSVFAIIRIFKARFGGDSDG